MAAALGGRRHPKSDPRFRALGALEELSASLGCTTADPSLPVSIRDDLHRLQRCLFTAGAAIAGDDPSASSGHFRSETVWLEGRIDETEEVLPSLARFILPGGSTAGALLHMARTICRRAEAEVVAYCRLEATEAGTDTRVSAEPPGDTAPVPTESHVCMPGRLHLLGWLNRLSDALFVMARHANKVAGAPETQWDGRASEGQ